MAAFVKGDLVVVPFPFSDLTNAKRRPAFELTELTNQIKEKYHDYCQRATHSRTRSNS